MLRHLMLGPLLLFLLLVSTSNYVICVHHGRSGAGFTNSWDFEQDAMVRSASGNLADLKPLEFKLVCGDVASIEEEGKHLEYKYEATSLVELFVIDQDAYKQKVTSEDEILSQGVILPDSYCIGKSCNTSCSIQGVQNWCLVFWNVDYRQVTANVTFQYKVTGADHDRSQIVAILCIACLILAFLLAVSCCGICIARKKRIAREKAIQNEQDQAQRLPLLNHYVPPNPQDFMYPLPPPPPPPPPPPHMMHSASQRSITGSFIQGQGALPVSQHPELQPNGGVQTPDVRGSSSRISKKGKKTKKTRLAFPI